MVSLNRGRPSLSDRLAKLGEHSETFREVGVSLLVIGLLVGVLRYFGLAQ